MEPETGPQRRLAAVISADVVGYAALMSTDERRTLAALRALRTEILEPAVALHRGSIVKSMGDGWLIMFAAAADAASFALQIQERLSEAGSMRLRMGVHVGDVTHVGDDIYGDGVNLAARLESFAPEGGIAISEAVFNGLEGQQRAQFAETEPQRFKNIDRRVNVWVHGGSDGQPIGTRHDPDLTSLTIEPFVAVGDDPDIALLADGLTEDLGVELARFRWLHVAGDSLVRYRIRGMVRGSQGRVRVRISLEHTLNGRRIWAERWERPDEDMQTLQDELIAEIIPVLSGEIDTHAKRMLRSRAEHSLSAAELIARANDLIGDPDLQSQRRAQALIERAIALEPDDPQAQSQMAFSLWLQAISGMLPLASTSRTALEHARRAIVLDRSWASAHAMAGAILSVMGETERALEAAERTGALNPNAWGASYGRALALSFARADYPADPEAIIANANETLRRAPRSAFSARHLCSLAFGMLLRDAAGPYDDALAALERAAAEPGTNWWAGVFIVAILLRQGAREAARRRLEAILAAFPHLSHRAVLDLFTPTRLGHDWADELAALPALGMPVSPPEELVAG